MNLSAIGTLTRNEIQFEEGEGYDPKERAAAWSGEATRYLLDRLGWSQSEAKVKYRRDTTEIGMYANIAGCWYWPGPDGRPFAVATAEDAALDALHDENVELATGEFDREAVRSQMQARAAEVLAIVRLADEAGMRAVADLDADHEAEQARRAAEDQGA